MTMKQKNLTKFYFIQPKLFKNKITPFGFSKYGTSCVAALVSLSPSVAAAIVFGARGIVLVETLRDLLHDPMVLMKTNVQTLCTMRIIGSYTFQPLWVCAFNQSIFHQANIMLVNNDLPKK